MAVRIFWTTCAAFLIAVFSASIIPLGHSAALALLFIAGACGVLGYIAGTEHGLILAIFFASVALGVTRFESARLFMPAIELGKKTELVGVVVRDPEYGDGSVRAVLQVDEGRQEWRVLMRLRDAAGIAYGDRVRVTGTLRLPESFEEGGRVFDYPMYLQKEGIALELSFADIEEVIGNEANPAIAAVYTIKHTYTRGLERAIKEPEASLAAGITAGDKRSLPAELLDAFRIAGLSHIVVLSGYNIMVVVDALFRMLRSAPAFASGIGIAVSLFFVVISGAAASSVRAAAMAIIAIIGRATGRTYLASRALALVACGMVLWNPYVLAFDTGFQLSVLATLGLIYISPIAHAWLTRIPERFLLRDVASGTIGAQIAVLPLLLYTTGLLSFVSVPVNLMTLIVVPIAMLFSFVAGAFGLLGGTIAAVVGIPAYMLLAYITSVAEFSAALPYSAVLLPPFHVAFLALAYLVLWAIVRRIHQKRPRETAASPISRGLHSET